MAFQNLDPIKLDVGLRDCASSGAFNESTGELRPGFDIDRDDIVLDVGCGHGDGRESQFCAKQGAHVIFSDIDHQNVAVAWRLLKDNGARALTPIVSDSNPLPLKDGIASKIIAAEVIEHVDDVTQFLGELVRVGRLGALYFLAVPDPVAEELQRGLAPAIHFQKPNHIRVIGRDEFAQMVTDAGLVIERRGSYGFYWSVWWMFFWICKVDLGEAAQHPLLESWSRTWNALLDTPGSEPVRQALDALMPKSQYIVARKPGALTRQDRPAIVRHTQPSGMGLRAVLRTIRRAALSLVRPTDGSSPAAELDSIDPKVVGLHDAVESGWFNMDRKELFEGFPITQDDVVLDVGCGDGNYSTICGQWGAHVIFTDIDPANVATTQTRLAATPARATTPIVGDANPLPLADETASRIISTEVIEHVDDPVQFLHELVRVGKKGALYLLAVPDPVQEGLQRQLAPTEFFERPKPGEGVIRGLSSGHLRTIGRDEFERMVTDAGLVVERRHFVSFYWALWFTFFWVCNVEFSDPRHPLLKSWARTWKFVLDSPDGHRVKDRLDAFMPKSQIIIARKP